MKMMTQLITSNIGTNQICKDRRFISWHVMTPYLGFLTKGGSKEKGITGNLRVCLWTSGIPLQNHRKPYTETPYLGQPPLRISREYRKPQGRLGKTPLSSTVPQPFWELHHIHLERSGGPVAWMFQWYLGKTPFVDLLGGLNSRKMR